MCFFVMKYLFGILLSVYKNFVNKIIETCGKNKWEIVCIFYVDWINYAIGDNITRFSVKESKVVECIIITYSSKTIYIYVRNCKWQLFIYSHTLLLKQPRNVHKCKITIQEIRDITPCMLNTVKWFQLLFEYNASITCNIIPSTDAP